MDAQVCKFCSEPMPPEKKGPGCEKCDEAHINRALKNVEIFCFLVPIFILTLIVLYGIAVGIDGWAFTLLYALVDASLIRHVVKIWRTRK